VVANLPGRRERGLGEQVGYAGSPEDPVASRPIFIRDTISAFSETYSFKTGKSHVTLAQG